MRRSAWTASTTGAKAQRGKSSTIDAATRSPSTSARSIRWTSSSSTRCWAGCSKLRSANQRPSKGLGAPCSSGEPDSAPHRATASSAVAGGRGGCPAWPGPGGAPARASPHSTSSGTQTSVRCPAEVLRQAHRITPIVLHPIPRLARDQGRRHDIAAMPQAGGSAPSPHNPRLGQTTHPDTSGRTTSSRPRTDIGPRDGKGECLHPGHR